MRSDFAEKHTVIRHYGRVDLFQNWVNFVAASAAYMALQIQDDAESAAYWFEQACHDGIVFG